MRGLCILSGGKGVIGFVKTGRRWLPDRICFKSSMRTQVQHESEVLLLKINSPMV